MDKLIVLLLIVLAVFSVYSVVMPGGALYIG
jgi:hypothetical protein